MQDPFWKKRIHFISQLIILKKIVEKNTKSKISLATIYNTVHAFQKKWLFKRNISER